MANSYASRQALYKELDYASLINYIEADKGAAG